MWMVRFLETCASSELLTAAQHAMFRFASPLFMLLLTGAIALGHPAGATGVRQTVTLLHELARRQEAGDPVSPRPVMECAVAVHLHRAL